MLCGLENGCIRLYNVLEPNTSPRIFRHSFDSTVSVTSVDFAPDNRHFASGGSDEVVTTWELETGRPLYCNKNHVSGITAVAYGPSATSAQFLLASAGHRVIRFVDALTGVHVRTLHGHQHTVNAIAFSPRDSALISGAKDGTLRLWQWRCGPLIATNWSHVQGVTGVIALPDRQHVCSVSDDQTLRIWSCNNSGVADEMLNCTEKQPGAITGVAVASDVPESNIALACADGVIRVYDWYGSRLQYTLQSDDGKSKGRSGGASDGSHAIHAIAMTSAGRWLVSSGSDGVLTVWSTHNRSVVRTIRVLGGGIATKLDISHDDQLLVASAGSYLIVYDLQTGYLVRSLYGHTAHATCAMFSPNGKLLVSGCDDGSIRAWDTISWEMLYVMSEHKQKVTSIAVNSDNTVIASGSWDGTIRLWSVQTGEKLYTLEGHSDGVTSVSFSKFGDQLFSGSLDRSIMKWDVGILQREPPFQYVFKMFFQAEYTAAHVAYLNHLLRDFPGVVNQRSGDGRCMFYLACERRRADTLKLLLSSTAANAFLLSSANQSALDLCMQRNEKECLKLLLMHTPKTFLHNRPIFCRVLVKLAKRFPQFLVPALRQLKPEPADKLVQIGVPSWELRDWETLREGASCHRPEGLWYSKLVDEDGVSAMLASVSSDDGGGNSGKHARNASVASVMSDEKQDGSAQSPFTPRGDDGATIALLESAKQSDDVGEPSVYVYDHYHDSCCCIVSAALRIYCICACFRFPSCPYCSYRVIQCVCHRIYNVSARLVVFWSYAEPSPSECPSKHASSAFLASPATTNTAKTIHSVYSRREI